MHVLDHYDSAVDHCADRDRDPAQRHDIRVDALKAHDDQRTDDADRQHEHDHQCRTNVEEKQQTH